MTEYIVVVALIAISCIGVVSLFGDDIRMLFAGAANALAGNENVVVKTQEAHQRHRHHKNLKNFGEDNQGAS
jgi:pilus assembly protein Flp/PilA